MYKKRFVRDGSVQNFNIGGNLRKSKQKKRFVRDGSVQNFNIGGNLRKSKQKKRLVTADFNNELATILARLKLIRSLPLVE